SGGNVTKNSWKSGSGARHTTVTSVCIHPPQGRAAMNRLLVSSLAAALLFLSAAAAAAPQQADDSNFNITYALELDAQGRITGLQPQPAMDSPALLARIESEVHGWSFRPAQLDGQPVPTR